MQNLLDDLQWNLFPRLGGHVREHLAAGAENIPAINPEHRVRLVLQLHPLPHAPNIIVYGRPHQLGVMHHVQNQRHHLGAARRVVRANDSRPSVLLCHIPPADHARAH